MICQNLFVPCGVFDYNRVYSDGWVVDKPWVTRLFEKAGIAQTFHISPLEMILSEKQMEIWQSTKDQVIQDKHVERHRASTDALIIQEAYVRTYLKTLGPSDTVDGSNDTG